MENVLIGVTANLDAALKWQFEAQERERATNRRTEYQQAQRTRHAEQERTKAHAEVVNVDRPSHNSR